MNVFKWLYLARKPDAPPTYRTRSTRVINQIAGMVEGREGYVVTPFERCTEKDAVEAKVFQVGTGAWTTVTVWGVSLRAECGIQLRTLLEAEDIKELPRNRIDGIEGVIARGIHFAIEDLEWEATTNG